MVAVSISSLLSLALGGSGLLALLGSAGHLGGNLAHGESSSLSVDHDLESLEVGEVIAGGLAGELLGDSSRGPLGSESLLGNDLLEATSAKSSLHGDGVSGEGESLQGVDASGEAAVDALDEETLLAGNINNNNWLAVVSAVVNEANSAWLNKGSVSLKTEKSQSLAVIPSASGRAPDPAGLQGDTQNPKVRVISRTIFFFWITILNNNWACLSP